MLISFRYTLYLYPTYTFIYVHIYIHIHIHIYIYIHIHIPIYHSFWLILIKWSFPKNGGSPISEIQRGFSKPSSYWGSPMETPKLRILRLGLSSDGPSGPIGCWIRIWLQGCSMQERFVFSAMLGVEWPFHGILGIYPLVNSHITMFFFFLMGKSTIPMAIFNSKLLVYQRVIGHIIHNNRMQ